MAIEVNDSKPRWVVDKRMNIAELGDTKKIACLGLAFKPNIDDLRESPALDIVQNLIAKGFNVIAVEPNIDSHDEIKLSNIENISKVKKFKISIKYQFLDNVFLSVLGNEPEKMPDIFFKMFKSSPKSVIKFLSNKGNFLDDLSIILKMPKWTFIKALFY